jgi:hypothetical protein
MSLYNMDIPEIIQALEIIDRVEPDKSSLLPVRGCAFCYTPTVKYSEVDAARLISLGASKDFNDKVRIETGMTAPENLIKNLIEGLKICFKNEPYAEDCDAENPHRPAMTYHWAVIYGELYPTSWPVPDVKRLFELGWKNNDGASYRWTYDFDDFVKDKE